jgi:hypothetical protein
MVLGKKSRGRGRRRLLCFRQRAKGVAPRRRRKKGLSCALWYCFGEGKGPTLAGFGRRQKKRGEAGGLVVACFFLQRGNE